MKYCRISDIFFNSLISVSKYNRDVLQFFSAKTQKLEDTKLLCLWGEDLWIIVLIQGGAAQVVHLGIFANLWWNSASLVGFM